MIIDYYSREIKIGDWVELYMHNEAWNKPDPAFRVFKHKSKQIASIESEMMNDFGYYGRYFKVKTQEDLDHIRKITKQ